MVAFTSSNVMKFSSGLLARRRIDNKSKMTVRTGSYDTGRQPGQTSDLPRKIFHYPSGPQILNLRARVACADCQYSRP
jgi:hypothetical protein